MLSRTYALGAGLGASLLTSGFFAIKSQQASQALQQLKKEHERHIQAIRNEPTSVTVNMKSSAFEKGSALLPLGQFDGRGKDVNVTFYVNETEQGNMHNTVGVSFGKKL